MRRLLSLLALLALVAAGVACQAEESDEGELRRFLLKSERQSRDFRYEEQLEENDDIAVAEGKFEDDLRWRGRLSINDEAVYEQIVSDDALAIRVLDSSRLPGFETASALAGNSQIIGQALEQGQWVIDFAAAPPLLAPVTREGSVDVGRNPVLDAYYMYQYARRAIEQGSDVWEYNKEDLLTYNRVYGGGDLDPFPEPNISQGIRRYDILPPPLPSRSQRGTAQALPTIPHFRRMAFFVKGDVVISVHEIIDIEARREFQLAREGQGAEFHLAVLESALAGATREPVRERSMVFELTLGTDVDISLPQTEVLTAGLGGIFGPEGVNLFEGGGEIAPGAPPPEESA